MGSNWRAIALAAALGAVATGAGQTREAELPSGWTLDAHFSTAVGGEDRWWHNFNDPLLDSLIAAGLSNNYDVAGALRRVEVSRAAVGAARSALLPRVEARAGWDGVGRGGGRAFGEAQWSLGATVAWEIDLFGKIRQGVKSKEIAADLSRARRRGVEVALAAEIASDYIALRTYQSQLKVAREHIASQRHILEMTRARHEAGLASMLDVTQAKIVVTSTEATIPPLEASIAAMANALSVLVGEFPGGGIETLLAAGDLPSEQHIVGIGVPADLLRRRPDIVEAELALAADAAAIGIAKKDFLPTLSLQGSVGVASRDIGKLMGSDSFSYSVAPTLTWTIFSGLERKYAVVEAREQMMADIDSYNMAVQTAVMEVDNAIAAYGGTLSNITKLEETVEESGKSLELSLDLYRNSLSSFTNVVDAQMNLLTYQNSLVAAKGKALQSLVTLYKALGGGWSPDNR